MDLKFESMQHDYCIKNYMLNEDEETQLRTLIGQLNWIASQTRPDLSHYVLQLSMKVNKATAKTLILANKTVAKN